MDFVFEMKPFVKQSTNFGKGRAFTAPHIRHAMDYIQEMASEEMTRNGWKMFDPDVALRCEVTAHLIRPSAHFNKKGVLKDSAPAHHLKRPDTSNLIDKPVVDALNGVCFMDDSQLVTLVYRKRFDTFEGYTVNLKEEK